MGALVCWTFDWDEDERYATIEGRSVHGENGLNTLLFMATNIIEFAEKEFGGEICWMRDPEANFPYMHRKKPKVVFRIKFKDEEVYKKFYSAVN